MGRHTSDTLYYHGASGTWTITAEQWRAVGVDNQDTITFESKRRDKYNKDDLSPEALAYLTEHHAREFQFMGQSSLEGTSDEKSSAPVAEGETTTGAPAPNGE